MAHSEMCLCLRKHVNRKPPRRESRCRASPVPIAADDCKQSPLLIAPSWTNDHESPKDRHTENIRHVSTDAARAAPTGRASRDHGRHELERVYRRHAGQSIIAPSSWRRTCTCPSRAGFFPADVYTGRCFPEIPDTSGQHHPATNSGDERPCKRAAKHGCKQTDGAISAAGSPARDRGGCLHFWGVAPDRQRYQSDCPHDQFWDARRLRQARSRSPSTARPVRDRRCVRFGHVPPESDRRARTHLQQLEPDRAGRTEGFACNRPTAGAGLSCFARSHQRTRLLCSPYRRSAMAPIQ